MRRLYDTYLKRFLIRLVTVFIGGVATYVYAQEDWEAALTTEAGIRGAIAAGVYALIALISPGEPHVGPGGKVDNA